MIEERTTSAHGCAALPGALCRHEVCNPRVFFLAKPFSFTQKKKATPWASSAGMYGGLTANPKNYHIRRLLVLKNEGDENAVASKDPWEVLDDEIEALVVDIQFPNDYRTKIDHDMSHWIPNTNEIHPLGKIEIGRGTPVGVFALHEDKKDIVLMPPADMYYKEGSNIASEGNIYNNGGTAFGFYAMQNESDDEGVLIAEFIPVTAGKTRNNSYTVSYNSNYFVTEGETKGAGTGANYLKVTADNTLEAFLGGRSYTLFGIKAQESLQTTAGNSTHPIRPGDDILLRFGLLNDTSNDPVIGEVSTGDFLAVYDKKMLWRANLYIAENGSDWNDVHRWVEGNEWNRAYSFSREFSESGLPPVNADVSGKQAMTPHGFTWQGNGTDYANGAVGYSIGCHDSPFEYNNKMDHQKTILNHYFSIDTPPYNAAGNHNLNGWARTTAPANVYLSAAQGNNKWDNYANAGITPVTINSETYYPYRPGYASRHGAAETNRLRSAGVDCVGLVQRSASYGSGETVNAYDLPDISGYTWLQAWNTQRRHIVTIEDRDLNDPESYQLWKITAKPNVGLPDNLDKVIPGDIVYYRGYHVMMVAAVEYEPGSRSTGVERIRLIEANYPQVMKLRDVADLVGTAENPISWIIGRLK